MYKPANIIGAQMLPGPGLWVSPPFFVVATAADIPIYAHRSPLPASLMKKHFHVIPTFFRRQFVIDHFYPRFFSYNRTFQHLQN